MDLKKVEYTSQRMPPVPERDTYMQPEGEGCQEGAKNRGPPHQGKLAGGANKRGITATDWCGDRCKPVCHGRAVQPVWVALWCGGAPPLPYPRDGYMGGIMVAPPRENLSTPRCLTAQHDFL